MPNDDLTTRAEAIRDELQNCPPHDEIELAAADIITDLLAANAALVERVKGLEGAGWQPIDNAPYSTTVEVRAGSMTFLATLEPGISENDAGESVDQWCAAIDGEHPSCWSDGGCWSSNQDENPSIQPTAWRAALNPGDAS